MTIVMNFFSRREWLARAAYCDRRATRLEEAEESPEMIPYWRKLADSARLTAQRLVEQGKAID